MRTARREFVGLETHLFFAIISLQFFWEGGLYRCLLVSKIIKLLRQFNKNSELIPASCKSCVSRPTNSRRAVRIGRKMKIHVKFIRHQNPLQTGIWPILFLQLYF